MEWGWGSYKKKKRKEKETVPRIKTFYVSDTSFEDKYNEFMKENYDNMSHFSLLYADQTLMVSYHYYRDAEEEVNHNNG